MNMHVAVARPPERELADGLEERQPLDVAGGAADLGDEHVAFVCSAMQVDAVLDFVGDVRNHLHGLAEILSLALVVQHRLVNLAAGQVVHARELRAGEPLVVAEVEVGLRAVVEHVHFAVLERATWCRDRR